MKVGVLQFFSWPRRRFPLEEVYERAMQRIEVMDQTGYDAVWLAEHHFNSFSVCPSVHMMGTMVAARTKNLRIGMAVSLAAFYHPLRLAEEVALLDIFSGGRVNWGAGRGFDPIEFRTFGVDHSTSYERFREHFEIVLEAWKNERVTYHGKFNDFENIEVLPKPMQKPYPPTWVAATSPPAIEWAASQGHTIMMDPHASFADIAHKRALYGERMAANGFSIEGRDIPMARLLAVAETHEEAAEIARRGAAWTVGSYATPKGNASIDTPIDDPVERYVSQVILYGTPEEVVDKVKRLEVELPLNYLMCAPLSHSSFVLFTERVLPKLI
jgi:alkanesulfonate monooxygenase SsuD/methylene tetrahydromethanopterin reductase-like flavin-dependent oxidoreductase (luciferase family)